MSSPAPRRALPEFAQAHLERYLATDGEDGHIWQGVPTLLLTTTGRKSGEPLQLPLIYGEDGDRLLVVASKGGAPDHPSWYKNLVANPEVQIQRKEEKFAAQARTAGPEEHQRLWAIMAKIWPAYDQYQARTERRIPVVIIER